MLLNVASALRSELHALVRASFRPSYPELRRGRAARAPPSLSSRRPRVQCREAESTSRRAIRKHDPPAAPLRLASLSLPAARPQLGLRGGLKLVVYHLLLVGQVTIVL